MAGDCGLNALSLLPENMLPQWQQKIALRAENPSGHTAYNDMVEAFSCRNNQAIGAEVVCIFTFFYIPYLFAKWQWILRKKSVRKS